MIDGVEADDVIGTLARQAAAARHACVVSTGDKDLTQLVNPCHPDQHHEQREAGRSRRDGQVRRAAGAIIDYLTLIGDTVDNVPGVEKVGPKTAVKWLTQYGTLDGVVAHAQEIGGVVGENLRRALRLAAAGEEAASPSIAMCRLPVITR